MLPSQRDWWELPNFIKLLVAGYGGGKTYIGALRALFLSSENNPIPGMYVSPTYKLAKKTIIPTVKEVLDRSNISYSYHLTDHEFHIHNWNGTFWIGSGDDPDSLRGPNLAWGIIDEPFIQSIAVLNQMLARIRHPEAKIRELGLTGTPEELNWGYDVATNADKKYDVGVAVGSTLDNIHLPEAYAQTLMAAYTPEMVRAYVHGEFVNLTTGRVCKPFDRNKHVIKHPDLKKMLKTHKIICGADFNVDYMSMIFWFDTGGHLHYFDEIRLDNSDTFEMARIARAKYPHAVDCYPDETGSNRHSSSVQSDHQILKDAGFRVICRSKNPPVKDRVNAWNRLLKDSRATIEQDTCPHFIKDNERMSWKKGKIDESDPAIKHMFDGGTYYVEYKYPIIKREGYTIQW